MKCARCGSNINDSKCPYCGYDNASNNQKDIKVQYEYGKIDQNEEKEKIIEPFENFNLSAIGHLLLGIGIYFGVSLLYSIIGKFVITIYCNTKNIQATDIPENTLTTIETILQCALYVFAILFVILILRKSIKQLFAEFKLKSTWINALKYFVFMYIALYIYSIILTLLNVTSSSANQSEVNKMIYTAPVFSFFFVGILAPIFEEIVFRLGIFRTIAFKNDKVALVATTLIFAFIHMTLSLVSGTFVADLSSLPSYLIGAFFITYSYYKTRHLATSICLHSLYNTLSFFLILILPYLQQGTELIRFFIR